MHGSTTHLPPLGLGIGWRPQLARAIERRPDIGFIEVVAENLSGAIPKAIRQLQDRGVRVVPHGISLSLGSAEGIDITGARALDELARRLSSPLVSEHIAFVRSGGLEAGHLLPVSRDRESLEVLVENVLRTRDVLSVPLALENISTLFAWPDGSGQMPESEFVSELLERTDTMLLLDVANVYANACNLGGDALALLEGLPLHRLAYVHMGGGVQTDGIYHDTHAHAVPAGAIELLNRLCARVEPPGVMLERDDNFPTERDLWREFDAIAYAVRQDGRGAVP